MSFSQAYVERHTRKNTFLRQVDQIIDWNPLEKEINYVYKKGQRVDGWPSCNGLIIFKMLLLETRYNLSDPGVEIWSMTV